MNTFVDESNPPSEIEPVYSNETLYLNNSSTHIDQRLYDVLENLERSWPVYNLNISSESQITELSRILKILPSIRSLTIVGRKLIDLSAMDKATRLTQLYIVWGPVRDVTVFPQLNTHNLNLTLEWNLPRVVPAFDEALRKMSRLRSLMIIRWPSPDANPLSSAKIGWLALEGGRIEHAHGIRCERMRFAACRKLKSLSGLHCKDLHILQCKELRELGYIEGLRSLHLGQQPKKSTLTIKKEFFSNKLVQFHCDREIISNLDVLKSTEALQLCNIKIHKDDRERIRTISKQNPKPLFWGSGWAFKDGKALDEPTRYEIEREVRAQLAKLKEEQREA